MGTHVTGTTPQAQVPTPHIWKSDQARLGDPRNTHSTVLQHRTKRAHLGFGCAKVCPSWHVTVRCSCRAAACARGATFQACASATGSWRGRDAHRTRARYANTAAPSSRTGRDAPPPRSDMQRGPASTVLLGPSGPRAATHVHARKPRPSAQRSLRGVRMLSVPRTPHNTLRVVPGARPIT